MDEGLAAAGLSSTNIELHTALAALVRDPALIERWRAGQDLTGPGLIPHGESVSPGSD
jgi:hypothetical protein